MKTIIRNTNKYKPKFSTKRNINYISDFSKTNLIKRVDSICEKYGYDYDEPIYEVVTTTSGNEMLMTSVNPNKKNSGYKGINDSTTITYEAKIKKVVS